MSAVLPRVANVPISPLRFEALVGAMGERTLADLDAAVRDRNRYLKLRRIAAENLAGVV